MLAEFIQLPKEGDTVGPYLLRQNLSTSILGAFYQATHKLKHENVLLHILPEALMRADSRFHHRYREVVARQAKLPPGAAMGVVEMHQISGNLVVQYPAGNYRSVNEVVLDRKEPLSEERVRELLLSMGRGLMEAARIDMGHYFMSPDYLFLDENGELRIAGIGLFQSINYECFERFVSGAVIPISMDKSRSFSALEILSPEIRNFKARDLRSDFYCIGMCAYFMLSGVKPERRWATLSKTRKEIGAGWDLFISHCLEPRPADRFPNYRAFLRDLEHIDELSLAPKREGERVMRTLKNLPLPVGMERLLNYRHLLFVRLILLGVAGFLTIGSASIFSHIIFSDFETDEQDLPIRRVVLPEQANLTITVQPANAQVSIRGPESGRFNVREGPLYLKGRSGRYTIQVVSPRRQGITRQVELRGSGPVREDFVLKPDFGTLRINGAVGTQVYVMPDDFFLVHVGTITGAEGLVLKDRLLKGKHRLVGLGEGLLPAVTGPVTLAGIPVEITLAQPPKPTEVVVTTQPEGATVLVDGRAMGLTPLTLEGLEPGMPLELRIEKEGYRTVVRPLLLEQGEDIAIDTGALELRIGTLVYRVDLSMPDPPDLRELMLSVDGTSRIVAASGTFELTEGMHELVLDHPDYFPLTERVVIMDRTSAEVVLTLQPRPVRLRPVVRADNPARFQVDDVETALTGQGYLPLPANQPVKVEAIIRDHLSVIARFEGRPNELMDWEVPLKPIPGPVAGEPWSPPYFDSPMVWLAPASFTLGSPINEFRRLPNEDTLTRVRLEAGFWIGRHEVTQDLYERVMRANPSSFKGGDLPVDSVTWDEAAEFCRRLTEFESRAGRVPPGYIYRLPTEAEWEYAARAATTTPFSFGADADPSKGNFHGSYSAGQIVGKSSELRYGSLPVGSFDPNPFGLYDVHGNLAEWTYDRFWDRHPGGMVINPVNMESGRGYTIRGGSWRDSADRVRTAAREGAPGGSARNSTGFRIALAPLARDPAP